MCLNYTRFLSLSDSMCVKGAGQRVLRNARDKGFAEMPIAAQLKHMPLFILFALARVTAAVTPYTLRDMDFFVRNLFFIIFAIELFFSSAHMIL